MATKRENKPKHSLHLNRSNDGGGKKNHRTSATVRRLKMYNCRPKRNTQGKILKVEFGSRDLPSTRIQPDRRWFPPTRVISQKELECFREEYEKRASNNYNVILRENKLPLSLLIKKNKARLEDVLVPKHKSAIIEATTSEALLRKADTPQAAPEQISAETCTKVDEAGGSNSTCSELYKVISSSDVVIQVLDARDPQGTRCYNLEKILKEKYKNKHMILLLNKCDLVPSWATKGWITVLSKEYPTLAFHANTSKPFGKDSLISVLRQYANLKSDEQAISVRFIGYPNVGKSSVMNTLRTENAFKVALTVGECKIWQHIKLTESIFLIDCPGVVYPDIISQSDLVLRGVVRVENLQDAAEHIREVLRRVKREHLERAYNIRDWEDENDFLAKLCNLTGNLLEGGDPDLLSAAKMVVDDLRKGKIPFFAPPPKQHEPNPSEC